VRVAGEQQQSRHGDEACDHGPDGRTEYLPGTRRAVCGRPRTRRPTRNIGIPVAAVNSLCNAGDTAAPRQVSLPYGIRHGQHRRRHAASSVRDADLPGRLRARRGHLRVLRQRRRGVRPRRGVGGTRLVRR
jgi:hypothetical protein